jgi:hypothetical protein
MMMRKWFPTYGKYLDGRQEGFVFLLVLITSMALFVSLSGILSLSMLNLSSAKRAMFDTSALYVAEAGADEAVFNINSNPAYTGTNTDCTFTGASELPVQLYSTTIKGKGTYESCVTTGTVAHELVVYVVGKVYRKSSDANPISKRKLKLIVEGSPAGAYAVQTGPGGLIMDNSATITNGPIYIGGYLTLNNTATIGSAGSPLSVNVANARCPDAHSAGYPSICMGNDQPNPITMNSPNTHIYGTVNANGQSNGAQMTNTGLAATSGVSAPSLPDYDRASQKAAVTGAGLTGAAASCSGSSTVTWPANVKITGNVTTGNNCTILVSGNTWITGNFTMSQKSIIKPAAGVTTQPNIMVDGSSGVTLNNQASVSTNANNIGMEFLTFYSAAACSPDCSSVTGIDLYNSQNLTTVNIGNQGDAPGSVFYARWSKVLVGQAGTIGALLGQTIEMGNSGNLSFVDTVSTGNYTYDVRYYELQ